LKKSCTRREKSKTTAIFMICLMAASLCFGLPSSSNIPVQELAEEFLPEEDAAISSSGDLPLRMDTPIVYDSESDRIIFFGGNVKTLTANYTDTWSYDYNNNIWTEMHPTIHPPALAWPAMTYGSSADRILLFGGYIGGTGIGWTNSDETWIYDYNSDTWTKKSPAISPPACSIGSMVYDSESDVFVLFGGFRDSTFSAPLMDETWIYNLTSNTWTNAAPSIHPSGRMGNSMTYDSESDFVILFGGVDQSQRTLTDTWTYDTNTNTWINKTTSQRPDILGCATYDTKFNRTVFFGGAESYAETAFRNETWAYDCNTNTWEHLNPTIAPDARARGYLTYDSESERILLFGGVLWGGWENETILHDCWSYDTETNLWNEVDSDWQIVTPTISPGVRVGSPLVYDVHSDRMVIFSGWQDFHSDSACYNDTWIYDYNTNSWTNMTPSALPPGRGAHAMAYSERDDVIVMFGGLSTHREYKPMADTWVYNMNTNTWTNMSPASNPIPRYYASMAYDNESDVFILFGGVIDSSYLGGYVPSDETWIYNLTANTWTEVAGPAHPDARYSAGLIYDYLGSRVLLGGGTGSLYDDYPNDIWEYQTSSNEWNKLTDITAPRPFGFTISYDLREGLIMAVGGPIDAWQSVFVRETWTFDPGSDLWTNMFSHYPPQSRGGHYLAYDIESGKTIMFGGAAPSYLSGEGFGDLWVYTHKINDEGYNDYDNDDLCNFLESQIGLDPDNSDSDSDLMPDGWEYFNGLNPLVDDSSGDADNDQLSNLGEYIHGTDPNDDDCDDDLISDGLEVLVYATNPWSNDTDHDLLTDYEEIYLTNTSALTNMTFPPVLDVDYDYDGDGLGNLEELRIYHTMPNNNDTDSDNATDGWEVLWRFDPLNPLDGSLDRDNDSLSNWQEEKYGTSPNVTDTDGDGFSDYWEVINGFRPNDPNVPLPEYLLAYVGYEVVAMIGVVALGIGYRAILLKEKSNVKHRLHQEEIERKRAFDELSEEIGAETEKMTDKTENKSA
jgi:N-acetylneuraminic acid mutarotase